MRANITMIIQMWKYAYDLYISILLSNFPIIQMEIVLFCFVISPKITELEYSFIATELLFKVCNIPVEHFFLKT